MLFCICFMWRRSDNTLFLENTLIFGRKLGSLRANGSEDLFFFLETTLIFGRKLGNLRANRSKDLFFFCNVEHHELQLYITIFVFLLKM